MLNQKEMPIMIDIIQDGMHKAHNLRCDMNDITAVYNTFDELMYNYQNLTSKKEIIIFDGFINKFIENSNNSVVNDFLKIKKIRTNFRNYNISSYQYFDGMKEYLDIINRDYNKIIYSFISAMSFLCNKLTRKIECYLANLLQRKDYYTLLKIWKYTPNPENNYLIPIHYDRSIFTIIIHTKNPGKERLVFYPNAKGLKVDEIAKNSFYQEKYIPKEEDFPLMFAGLHAKNILNLQAIPHAVEQVEIENILESRYSIVFFVVPSTSINIDIDYVAQDKFV